MASQKSGDGPPLGFSNEHNDAEAAVVGDEDESKPRPVVFSAAEEAALLSESNDKKSQANTLFTSQDYPAALSKYDEAISACPHHLDYELAVLRCNVSACHLKLREWKDAVSSATAALDGLARVDAAREEEESAAAEEAKAEDEDVEEEIISSGAANAAPAPPAPSEAGSDERARRTADVRRIRAKALMRRARARSEIGGWQNLAGAEEDYKALAAMDNLGPADRRIVGQQLRELPARTKAAQEVETAEMWGKLKDLGNGILRPFGLSTDNFQMKKDEQTGGYSMNFNGGGSSSTPPA